MTTTTYLFLYFTRF